MKANNIYLLSHDQYLIEYWGKINNNVWIINPIQIISDFLSLSVGQIVIMDTNIITTANAEAIQKILSQHQVVVASSNPNDPEGQAVLVQGAKAYVHAYSSTSIWHQVLTQVQNGKIWLGTHLVSRLLSDLAKKMPLQNEWKADLTDTEADVAERVVLGHSNTLIAKDLNLPEQTVQAHLTSVLTKFNANDRLDLALRVYTA